MIESANETARSLRQLLLIVAFLVLGYFCNRMLQFTSDRLNLIFACAICAIPLLAIRPVLRLHRQLKVWGLMVLTPLLLYSLFSLLVGIVFGGAERTQTLQTFQQGNSTILLQRYENGGAVGVHGLILEQRRLILPGLYVVKSIDFFDSAKEGTLSVDGLHTVSVYAKGSYDSNSYQVDKIYHLKPWVYF
jgi:hypothetical protein